MKSPTKAKNFTWSTVVFLNFVGIYNIVTKSSWNRLIAAMPKKNGPAISILCFLFVDLRLLMQCLFSIVLRELQNKMNCLSENNSNKNDSIIEKVKKNWSTIIKNCNNRFIASWLT